MEDIETALTKKMESLQYSDFEKVCRTCLSMVNLYPIFHLHYDQLPFATLLQINSLIEFDETDDYPKNICNTCISSLVHAYNFRKQCITAQNCLEDIKNEYYSSQINSDEEFEIIHIKIVSDDSDVEVISSDNENESNNYKTCESSEPTAALNENELQIAAENKSIITNDCKVTNGLKIKKDPGLINRSKMTNGPNITNRSKISNRLQISNRSKIASGSKIANTSKTIRKFKNTNRPKMSNRSKIVYRSKNTNKSKMANSSKITNGFKTACKITTRSKITNNSKIMPTSKTSSKSGIASRSKLINRAKRINRTKITNQAKNILEDVQFQNEHKEADEPKSNIELQESFENDVSKYDLEYLNNDCIFKDDDELISIGQQFNNSNVASTSNLNKIENYIEDSLDMPEEGFLSLEDVGEEADSKNPFDIEPETLINEMQAVEGNFSEIVPNKQITKKQTGPVNQKTRTRNIQNIKNIRGKTNNLLNQEAKVKTRAMKNKEPGETRKILREGKWKQGKINYKLRESKRKQLNTKWEQEKQAVSDENQDETKEKQDKTKEIQCKTKEIQGKTKEIRGKTKEIRGKTKQIQGKTKDIQYKTKGIHGKAKGKHVRTRQKPVKPIEKPYLCQICPMAFSLFPNLMRHTRLAHFKYTLYKCEICHRSFNRMKLYKMHVNRHDYDSNRLKELQLDGNYSGCNDFDGSCFKNNDLEKGNCLNINNCERTSGNNNFKRNSLNKNGSDRNSSENEDFKGNNSIDHDSNVNNSINDDSTGNIYNCTEENDYQRDNSKQICYLKKNSKNKCKSKPHVLKNGSCDKNSTKYKIDKCEISKTVQNKSCEAADNEGVEAKYGLNAAQSEYQCEVCSKAYKSYNSFKQHQRFHNINTICLICNQNCKDKNTLNVHMKTHTGEKVYKCYVCKKEFILFRNLKTHLRLHTDDRLHQCTLCNKRFKQLAHLQQHIQRHSNELPYECSYCQKAFNNKYSLQLHIGIHTLKVTLP